MKIMKPINMKINLLKEEEFKMEFFDEYFDLDVILEEHDSELTDLVEADLTAVEMELGDIVLLTITKDLETDGWFNLELSGDNVSNVEGFEEALDISAESVDSLKEEITEFISNFIDKASETE